MDPNLFANILDFILKIFEGILSAPSEVIGLVIGAAGVSFLTQVFKKWADIESEKKVVALFALISSIASGFDYVISQASGNALPPSVLGVNTALIMGVAQPIYFYGIKPANKFLIAMREYQKQMKSKVSDMEAINKTNDIDSPTLKESVETPAGTVESEVLPPKQVDAPKPAVTPTGIPYADF